MATQIVPLSGSTNVSTGGLYRITINSKLQPGYSVDRLTRIARTDNITTTAYKLTVKQTTTMGQLLDAIGFTMDDVTYWNDINAQIGDNGSYLVQSTPSVTTTLTPGQYFWVAPMPNGYTRPSSVVS